MPILLICKNTLEVNFESPLANKHLATARRTQTPNPAQSPNYCGQNTEKRPRRPAQLLDRKIQTITRFLFRLIGRLVLGGGGGGDDGGAAGGGTSATSSGGASSSSAGGGKGRRISITLPTYPPGLDDEDEDEDEDEDNDTAASANDVIQSASEPKAVQAQPPSGVLFSHNLSLARVDAAKKQTLIPLLLLSLADVDAADAK